MREVTFTSHGVTCAAWHVPATTDLLAGPGGRPIVVMANGFGGTRDCGLLFFAEPLADAGFDVLVFDYRGFGDSAGDDRQDVNVKRQREDYHAAIDAARHLPGVDAGRIALWGTSYAGGHSVVVASENAHVAAIVAMNPATDGRAALMQMARYGGVSQLAKATLDGLRDAGRTLRRKEPHFVPIVAQPGQRAMMSTPGAEEAYLAIAGPTWQNKVRARGALEVGLNRPVAVADKVRRPALFQIGSEDQIAPPAPARLAAAKAPLAEVREYPLDHFDFYTLPWAEKLIADQIEFLSRVLAVA